MSSLLDSAPFRSPGTTVDTTFGVSPNRAPQPERRFRRSKLPENPFRPAFRSCSEISARLLVASAPLPRTGKVYGALRARTSSKGNRPVVSGRSRCRSARRWIPMRVQLRCRGRARSSLRRSGPLIPASEPEKYEGSAAEAGSSTRYTHAKTREPTRSELHRLTMRPPNNTRTRYFTNRYRAMIATWVREFSENKRGYAISGRGRK